MAGQEWGARRAVGVSGGGGGFLRGPGQASEAWARGEVARSMTRVVRRNPASS